MKDIFKIAAGCILALVILFLGYAVVRYIGGFFGLF
jgi:hypothetical protein